jgi:membrane protease YdiL (CAAX protease family)
VGRTFSIVSLELRKLSSRMLSDKPWQPEQVLQLLIRLFASMLIGMVVGGWISSTNWLGPTQAKFFALIVGTLSFHGVALLLTAALLREHALSWDEAFGFLSPQFGRALLLGLLLAMAVLPIAWSLGQVSAKIMEALGAKPVVQSPVQMLQTASSLPTKLLIGFLAILVAPVAEEVVFRGLIYPTLKQHGFPNLALWGTSLLFAAIHDNLMILLPLTFLAIMLTLLYEATGNLLAPILAHSLFNFVNFFWVVAAPGTPLMPGSP